MNYVAHHTLGHNLFMQGIIAIGIAIGLVAMLTIIIKHRKERS